MVLNAYTQLEHQRVDMGCRVEPWTNIHFVSSLRDHAFWVTYSVELTMEHYVIIRNCGIKKLLFHINNQFILSTIRFLTGLVELFLDGYLIRFLD